MWIEFRTYTQNSHPNPHPNLNPESDKYTQIQDQHHKSNLNRNPHANSNGISESKLQFRINITPVSDANPDSKPQLSFRSGFRFGITYLDFGWDVDSV